MRSPAAHRALRGFAWSAAGSAALWRNLYRLTL